MPKRGQVIVDDYLRRIVAGELAEGELLPTETAMIEQYQVSRTAVREGVQTLAHKGFVKIRQGSGSTVAPRYMWNLLDADYMALTGGSDSLASDLNDVSDILEPATAGIAASHATSEQIESLRQLVIRMAETTDPEKLSHLDAEFHHAVAECTGNPVLRSLLNSMVALGKTAAGAEADRAGSTTKSAQVATWSEHVVEAIASRDGEAARDAMRMHLRKLHRA